MDGDNMKQNLPVYSFVDFIIAGIRNASLKMR